MIERKKNMKKTISIVIPAFNEKDGIEKTVKAAPTAELAAMGYRTQIVVVDNDSLDDTGVRAQKAGAEVIREPRRGYGRAYKTGFANAEGDIIATCDADATYPLESIPELVKILEMESLDFITTNRFPLMENGAMSFRNKLGNTILSIAVRLIFGLKMRDPESGMWVFRKNILDNMRLDSNIWPFSHELKLEACYYNKYRWKEVPIRYKARAGNSKLLRGWLVGVLDLYHIIKMRITR